MGDGGGVASFVLVVIALAVYFLPSIAAGSRDHPSTNGIFVLNLFLGWTLVGWVIALAWSLSAIYPTVDSSPAEIPPPPRSSEAKTGGLTGALRPGQIVEMELDGELVQYVVAEDGRTLHRVVG